MRRRIVAALLVVALFLSFPATVFACDEDQSNLYVLQILFGKDASFYEDNADVNKLLSALYICSEQADENGQDKLNALKKAKVGGVPTLAKINVSGAGPEGTQHVLKEYANKTSQLERDDGGAGGYSLKSAEHEARHHGWAEYVYTIRSANFGKGRRWC